MKPYVMKPIKNTITKKQFYVVSMELVKRLTKSESKFSGVVIINADSEEECQSIYVKYCASFADTHNRIFRCKKIEDCKHETYYIDYLVLYDDYLRKYNIHWIKRELNLKRFYDSHETNIFISSSEKALFDPEPIFTKCISLCFNPKMVIHHQPLIVDELRIPFIDEHFSKESSNLVIFGVDTPIGQVMQFVKFVKYNSPNTKVYMYSANKLLKIYDNYFDDPTSPGISIFM